MLGLPRQSETTFSKTGRNKPGAKPAPGEKLIVLCIDRDDDLGRKTSFDGPIVGEKKCLEAAVALSMADPADNDSNTMFEAIRAAREIGSEVAVITGSVKVGVASDRIVSNQLDAVLGKGKYNGAILVSDGSEDEQILPLIQSRIKISGVKRLVVKQAERLENTYYTAMDWLKKIMKDREMARFVFGVPGIIALLLALFGMSGWRVILTVVGGFLLLRGFQLESTILGLASDFKTSFKFMRFSFLTYVVSIVMVGVAIYRGLATMAGSTSLVNTVFAFLHGSLFYFLMAAIAIVVGKTIDSFPNFSLMLHYINTGVLVGVSVWVLKSASSYFLEPTAGLTNLVTSVIIGLIFTFMMEIIKNIAIKWYF
jgi:putative membrane protein